MITSENIEKQLSIKYSESSGVGIIKIIDINKHLSNVRRVQNKINKILVYD